MHLCQLTHISKLSPIKLTLHIFNEFQQEMFPMAAEHEETSTVGLEGYPFPLFISVIILKVEKKELFFFQHYQWNIKALNLKFRA